MRNEVPKKKQHFKLLHCIDLSFFDLFFPPVKSNDQMK